MHRTTLWNKYSAIVTICRYLQKKKKRTIKFQEFSIQVDLASNKSRIFK